MKSLILIIAMFIVSFVNSQVYTITTQEGNSVVMIGENDYKVVMKNGNICRAAKKIQKNKLK